MSEFIIAILPYLAALVVSMLFFTPVAWGFFFTNSLLGTLGNVAEDYLQTCKERKALEDYPEELLKVQAEKKDLLPSYLSWSFSMIIILCFFLEMYHLNSIQKTDYITTQPIQLASLQSEQGVIQQIVNDVGTERIEVVQLDGKTIYENNCLSCHQANGDGIANVFPPLNKSEWVNGNPNTIVKIILKGLNGPIQVLGVEYNSVMTAVGANLSDQDITNVVNYIRTTWENNSSEITLDQVIAVKEEVSDRTTAWTAAELQE